MINKTTLLSALTLGCCLGACSPQTTPSMMNLNRPQLTSETVMQQVKVKDVNDAYIHKKVTVAASEYGNADNQRNRGSRL